MLKSMNKVLCWLPFCILVFVLGSATAEPPSPSLTPDELLTVQLINAERVERKLEPLHLDPILVEVARQHSEDMATRAYFDHLAPAPQPKTPMDRYAVAIGRKPEIVVGENIGHSAEPVMGIIHEYMMDSPEHRANILDAEYVSVGVGIYMLNDGRVWLTEMFRGERRGERADERDTTRSSAAG